MSEQSSPRTEHDQLNVTFRDGEPTTIRTNLRLVGSDAVFKVDDGVANLIAATGEQPVDELVAEVEKLSFIESVEVS